MNHKNMLRLIRILTKSHTPVDHDEVAASASDQTGQQASFSIVAEPAPRLAHGSNQECAPAYGHDNVHVQNRAPLGTLDTSVASDRRVASPSLSAKSSALGNLMQRHSTIRGIESDGNSAPMVDRRRSSYTPTLPHSEAQRANEAFQAHLPSRSDREWGKLGNGSEDELLNDDDDVLWTVEFLDDYLELLNQELPAIAETENLETFRNAEPLHLPEESRNPLYESTLVDHTEQTVPEEGLTGNSATERHGTPQTAARLLNRMAHARPRSLKQILRLKRSTDGSAS